MPRAILVADDDRDIASVLTDLLIDEGYQASTAFDGQQALECVEREEIDLIVSDIRMPRLDGVGLVRRLRELGWEKPVVLMSAVESMQPGRDDVTFLRKPIDLDDLLDVVARLLDGGGEAPSG